MSTPIPRPPGLWHALARDAALNPAEQAARDTVIAAHTDHPPAAAVPGGSVPLQRLAPYQVLIERAGWRLQTDTAGGRARVEGFHPSGAAALVTAGRDGVVKAYVLPAARKNTPCWSEIHPMALAHWLRHRTLTESDVPRRPRSRCACRKRRYPSEAYAARSLVDATIRRVVKRHGRQKECRAYRCPDDDLVWHLTSLPEWPRPATDLRKDTVR
jgi:hypothetical protein